MAEGTQISISMLLKLATDQAKRDLASFSAEVRNLGTTSATAGAQTRAAGDAIDQAGTDARTAAADLSSASGALGATAAEAAGVAVQMGHTASATLGARDAVTGLAGAGATLSGNLSGISSAGASVSTAMQGAIAATTGLTRAIGDQVTAMQAEQRASAAWRQELDAIRAKFSPLFAASQQYERELREIASAEQLGAISAQEATAARARAAQVLRPVQSGLGQYAGAANIAAGSTANLFSQWNDIAVMMAAGQSPMQLALQQGTQVSQVLIGLGGGTSALKAIGASFLAMLNPISLATIGIIAFGAAGVQALSKLGGETKTFDDHLKNLTDTLDRMKSGLDRVGDLHLSDQFGNMTTSVQALTQGMLALDRASELKSLQGTVDKFLDKQTGEGVWQWLGRSFVVGGMGTDAGNLYSGVMSDAIQKANEASNYKALGAANSFDDFQARTKEISNLADAGKVEDVIGKLKDLQAAMSNGGTYTGMKKELRDLLNELTEAGIKTAQVEALWNNTAHDSSNTRMIDEMVRGWKQEAEIAQASVRYGADSYELEQKRAEQLRTGLAYRLQEMRVQEGSANWQRAYAALEGKIIADQRLAAQERQKSEAEIFTDLSRQAEVSIAIQRYGENSKEVEVVRAAQAQSILKSRLEEMGMSPALIAAALEMSRAEQDRARAIKDAAAAKKSSELLSDLRSEAQINAAIVQYGRDSVQVKQLQIAAERRNFEQTLATLQVSEAMKGQLRQAWEAAKGLSAADPYGSMTAANEYLRSQAERIAKLQLEQSLLGQSETTQKRLMALWQAERDIQKQGIDATSDRAREIRDLAEQEAALTATLERQKSAWGEVQSAASDAIDGIVDDLLGGNFDDAVSTLGKQIVSMFSTLAIKNPLKNAVLGTNLGTFDDVGGFQGIWNRMTGKEGSTPSMATAMSTPNMAVTANTVTLNGTLSGLGPGAAANINGLPSGSVAGLTGSSDIQQQVWRFFAGKGLKDHQIAGILGNISGESGFNPLAQGDYANGQYNAFGLAQWNDRAPALFDAIGGKQNLGNVQAQLEFMWKELTTTESGAMQKLLASTDVRGATTAFMTGYERPSDTASLNNRIAAANQALSTFGSTTQTATRGLGALGTGFDTFGSALAGVLSGQTSAGGALTSLIPSALSGAASLLGTLPGFAAGSYTGGTDPSRVAGVVHEQEFVFDAAATRRIGATNLESLRRGTMRGYATGGYVSTSPVPSLGRSASTEASPRTGGGTKVDIAVNNYTGQQVSTEEQTDAAGNRRVVMTVGDQMAAAINTPGNAADKAIRSRYGSKPRTIRR